MSDKVIDPKILSRAGIWLGANFDEETRRQVQDMMDNNPQELSDAHG